MKVKILKSSGSNEHFVGSEFEIDQYVVDDYLGFHIEGIGWIYRPHCVITELPESFSVKRCDDGIKWGKYIQWLTKKCGKKLDGSSYKYYGLKTTGVCFNGGIGFGNKIVGTEIHIDDMIKHIDYMEYMESQQHINGGEQFHKESQLIVKMDKILKEEEFDLTTNEGRLAYARQHYPIGTKYVPLSDSGQAYDGIEISEYKPRIWVNDWDSTNGIKVGRVGLIYHEKSNKWAEIIMDTQKLSRQGLKEIHSIACSSWKITLEGWGSRNPLEDYIELTQEEVNNMFDASDNNQKSILSKYLKQDDGSVDVTKFNVSGKGFCDNNHYIIRDREIGKYKRKSFLLSSQYSWEFREDEIGELCLIPTKKK
jgi:hypothetical protein